MVGFRALVRGLGFRTLPRVFSGILVRNKLGTVIGSWVMLGGRVVVLASTQKPRRVWGLNHKKMVLGKLVSIRVEGLRV